MQDSKTLATACPLRVEFSAHAEGLSPLRDFAPGKAGCSPAPIAMVSRLHLAIAGDHS